MFFFVVVVSVCSGGLQRLAKGTHQAHHFVELCWVREDAAKAFGVDGVERRIKQLPNSDSTKLTDMVLQQGEKAQLLTVECMRLREGRELHIHGRVIKANDSSQDLRQLNGGVRIELPQRGKIDIGVAGM